MFDSDEAPLERLEAEICAHATRLAAATCSWLLLIAAFDRRRGWAGWGMRSCAHWLSWKCGLDARTGHEHLRVGRALADLPSLRAAFAAGSLSYAKVRAITRVAQPATDDVWVRLARSSTAAQLEQVVRSSRTVPGLTLPGVNARHARRRCQWRWDDDGMLVLSARFSPEEGAVVVAAIEAARDGLRSAERDRREQPTAAQADGMVAIAETFLADGGTARSHPGRNEVVIHVDAAEIQPGRAPDPPGRGEIDGGPALHPETVRRLLCDAGTVELTEGPGTAASPIDVGRRTRTITPALRRALDNRDHGCGFPGCDQVRYTDGHHIEEWSRGGRTDLANLVTLCRRHHRAVHEDGFTITVDLTGPSWSCTFHRPDGTLVPAVPQPPVPADLDLPTPRDRAAIIPDRWGDPLDLPAAIDGLVTAADREPAAA